MSSEIAKIKCPQCGAGLRLSLPLPVGQVLQCPACKGPIQVNQQAIAQPPSVEIDAPADRRTVAMLVAIGVMVAVIGALAAVLMTRDGEAVQAKTDPAAVEQVPAVGAQGGTKSGPPHTTASRPDGKTADTPTGQDDTFLPPESSKKSVAQKSAATDDVPTVSPDEKSEPSNVNDPAKVAPPVDLPPDDRAIAAPEIGQAPVNQIPGLPPGPIYYYLPYLSSQGLVAMPDGLPLSSAQPALVVDVNSIVVPESGKQLGTDAVTFVVGLWQTPTAPVVLQLISSSPSIEVEPSEVTLTADTKSARIEVQGANTDTTPTEAGVSSLTKATITISVTTTTDAAYFAARPQRTIDVWMVDDDQQGLAWNALPGDLDTSGKLKTLPGTGTDGTRLFVQLRAPLKSGASAYVVVKNDTPERAAVIPFDAPGATSVSGAVVLKFDSTNPWNKRQELKIQGTTQTGDFNLVLEPVQVVDGKVQKTLINGKEVAPLATAPASLDQEFFKVRSGTQPATNATP